MSIDLSGAFNMIIAAWEILQNLNAKPMIAQKTDALYISLSLL
jgi:hypothetical protein